MYDDDVRIRQANPEEADELTDIAWRSEGYWDYPQEEMHQRRNWLNVTEDYVEKNVCFVLEHEDTGEKVGFYSLEKEEGKVWMKRLWVLPEEIGTGVGGKLFLHACEAAETIGADEMYILTDPNSEDFFLHMGAERVGRRLMPNADGEETGRMNPVLRMRLSA